MRPVGSDRIAGIGTSIFTEITALAVKHEAVNLGQGFPDFRRARLRQAGGGAPHPRRPQPVRRQPGRAAAARGAGRRLAARCTRTRAPSIPTSEITVGSGATELLHDAVLATVNPGDEVIVFEPTYDAYAPDVAMAGGVRARRCRWRRPTGASIRTGWRRRSGRARAR